MKACPWSITVQPITASWSRNGFSTWKYSDIVVQTVSRLGWLLRSQRRRLSPPCGDTPDRWLRFLLLEGCSCGTTFHPTPFVSGIRTRPVRRSCIRPSFCSRSCLRCRLHAATLLSAVSKMLESCDDSSESRGTATRSLPTVGRFRPAFAPESLNRKNWFWPRSVIRKRPRNRLSFSGSFKRTSARCWFTYASPRVSSATATIPKSAVIEMMTSFGSTAVRCPSVVPGSATRVMLSQRKLMCSRVKFPIRKKSGPVSL